MNLLTSKNYLSLVSHWCQSLKKKTKKQSKLNVLLLNLERQYLGAPKSVISAFHFLFQLLRSLHQRLLHLQLLLRLRGLHLNQVLPCMAVLHLEHHLNYLDKIQDCTNFEKDDEKERTEKQAGLHIPCYWNFTALLTTCHGSILTMITQLHPITMAVNVDGIIAATDKNHFYSAQHCNEGNCHLCHCHGVNLHRGNSLGHKCVVLFWLKIKQRLHFFDVFFAPSI